MKVFKDTKRKIIITFLIWLFFFNLLPLWFFPLTSGLSVIFIFLKKEFEILEEFSFLGLEPSSLMKVYFVLTLAISWMGAYFLDLFLKIKKIQFLTQKIWKGKRKWLTIGVMLILLIFLQCFSPGVIIEAQRKYKKGERIEITAHPIRMIFEPLINESQWNLYKFEKGKWEKVDTEPSFPENIEEIRYFCGEAGKCGELIPSPLLPPFVVIPEYLPLLLRKPQSWDWDQVRGYEIEECLLNEKEKVKCYRKKFAEAGRYKIEFSYWSIYFPKFKLKKPYFEEFYHLKRSQVKEFLIE
jgi:hypothetical protein